MQSESVPTVEIGLKRKSRLNFRFASIMGGLALRDLWLLPLISFATVLVLLGVSEIGARMIWPEQLVNKCAIADPALGTRYRPDCAARMKAAEGPWYVSAYNACGLRSNAPCGPEPVGTRRVALLGTSLGEGYLVKYENTIAGRLGRDLRGLCRAPVEVENLSAQGSFGNPFIARLDKALKLDPQAVVLVLAPFDIETDLDDVSGKADLPQPVSFQKRVFDVLKSSRTVTMAQHFLFENPAVYLPLYLRYGDKADFLRPPFSAKWRQRLAVFDSLVGKLAARAQSAGVPLTLAFIPQEAQVALMVPGRTVPSGVDPTAFPSALAAIAAKHGVGFIDTSMALHKNHAPEQLYYQVDGHLSGKGQPIAATYIAQKLAGSGSFADCGRTAGSQAGL